MIPERVRETVDSCKTKGGANCSMLLGTRAGASNFPKVRE